MTRRAILEAAGEEFARNGCAGSGLGAIVARAGLTKGALFHHFPDKRSLVLGWVADELLPSLRERWLAPLQSVGSIDDLKAWCRGRILKLENGDPLSVLAAVAAETAPADEGISQAFEGAMGEFRDAVASAIERGKEAAWIHPSIQPPAEAGLLLAMLLGFSVAFRCGGADASHRQSVAAAEAYLETLRKI